MLRNWKFIAVIVVCTVGSFALTPVIWPFATAGGPPSSLAPLFVVLGIFESLAFGVGVAFLIWGWPLLQRVGQPYWLTLLAYVSIGWYLVNWWPHDNLHRVIGVSYGQLAAVEYGFHVTMQIAGGILALFFVRVATSAKRAQPAA